MKGFWLALFLFTCLLPQILFGTPIWKAQSGAFSAAVTLSSQNISIDNQLQIELALTYPEDYHPDADTIRTNLARQDNFGEPSFQIVSDKTNLPTSGQNGVITGTMVFTLEPQLAGKFELTFLNIPFLPNKEGGKKTELISGLFNVSVNIPPAGPNFNGIIAPLMTLSPKLPIEIDPSNRMKYIQNPVLDKKAAERNVAFLKSHTFPWKLILITLAFIGAVLMLLRAERADASRRKKAAREKDIKARALETLEILAKQDFTRMKLDPAYVQMTNTVRLFIESRYQVKAARMTTEEFLHRMKEHPIFDVSTRMQLSQFLVSSDKVKFAHHIPTAEEFRQAVGDALKFIASQQ